MYGAVHKVKLLHTAWHCLFDVLLDTLYVLHLHTPCGNLVRFRFIKNKNISMGMSIAGSWSCISRHPKW